MSRGKRFLICVNREKTKQERNFLNFSVAGWLAEKKLFYRRGPAISSPNEEALNSDCGADRDTLARERSGIPAIRLQQQVRFGCRSAQARPPTVLD
jgi:hypothetical protein